MDAVASNAVALGLTKLTALGVSPAAALPSLAAALPVALPAALPVVLPVALPPAAAIPPPGVVIPRAEPAPAPPPPADAPAQQQQAALQQKASPARSLSPSRSHSPLTPRSRPQLLDAEPDTLQQQESLSISGQSARHLVMQRLMRRRASRTLLLANMVAAEEVDEALHHEIQEECAKWGRVERLVIYNERQAEDDDPAHARVKIFVQFAQSEGQSHVLVSLEWNFVCVHGARRELILRINKWVAFYSEKKKIKPRGAAFFVSHIRRDGLTRHIPFALCMRIRLPVH